MSDARDESGRSGQQYESTGRRWMVTVNGLLLLLMGSTMPTSAEASSFSAGTIDDPRVPVNCSHAVMTTAPKFLSFPKGSAKYPFSMKCTSPVRPGLMIFTWEGSWNPSETRRDRPNAVESLFIEGYEPFIPGRTGGKIFLYWTASCTADPWLQGGSCSRFGAYVPDDLRAAIPDIDGRPFPLTGKSISPSLRQQLFVDYQRVNSQTSMSPGNLQNLQAPNLQQQSQNIITQPKQAQAMIVVPQTTLPKPDTTMGSAVARSNILPRGVEPTDPQQSPQTTQEKQPANAESSSPAILDVGTQQIAEPIAITLDRPFHTMNAKGDTVEIKPGVYEIGAIMDVQLGLAKEGQPTVLLNAKRDTHSIPIHRTIAAVIPGPSEDLHLLLLTTDGSRFDAVGFESGVKSRSVDRVAALSDTAIEKAVAAASTTSRSVSSPSCQPNPAEIGPLWIPVPCTMPVTPPAP